MGYCITQGDTEFAITDKAGALAAIKELANDRDYFSWVNGEEVRDAETVREAFRAWRWELDSEGLYFCGEKLGEDALLFETVAPYVKDGSYIVIRGEDGDTWKWLFEDGKFQELTGKVVFFP